MSKAPGPVYTLIAELAAGWTARDAAAVSALFDAADPEVTYLAADALDPATGAAAIARAIAERCAGAARIAWRAHGVHARELGDGLAMAFMLVDKAAAERGAPLAAQQVRATLICGRRAGRWLILHYAEAPLAPLLELQAFYEQVAAQGLDAIPPRPWGPPA
ncbi:MAG: nuclear transport factor 2 family protein [Rhodospirillaceae bacterium]|nr:nuclear transport factor 2 family protein [Rhodospirillaceae bacterium]